MLPRRHREALAGILGPGNAAANSGADQLAVVDAAIAQLPAARQAGHHADDGADMVEHRVLVRADTAGAVRGFIDGLVSRNSEFSVGGRVCARLDAPIAAVAPDAWVAARDANGTPRRGAQVVELDVTLDHWPSGTRAICRREKPHPCLRRQRRVDGIGPHRRTGRAAPPLWSNAPRQS